jgi:nucleoid-associated protein YgaU
LTEGGNRVRKVMLVTSLLIATLPFSTGCDRKAGTGQAATDANNAIATDTTSNNDETLSAAGADVAAGNVTAARPGEPLAKYEGQRAGEGFLDDPLVKKAVAAAVPDRKIRDFVLAGAGPESPIKVDGGRLIATGCEAHKCGFHHWSIAIAPNGGNAEVCYFETENAQTGRAKYYVPGRKMTEKAEDCPG